jgi:hypothetical protein
MRQRRDWASVLVVEEELDDVPPRRRTLLDWAKAQLGALGDARFRRAK